MDCVRRQGDAIGLRSLTRPRPSESAAIAVALSFRSKGKRGLSVLKFLCCATRITKIS